MLGLRNLRSSKTAALTSSIHSGAVSVAQDFNNECKCSAKSIVDGRLLGGNLNDDHSQIVSYSLPDLGHYCIPYHTGDRLMSDARFFTFPLQVSGLGIF